jgi:homoserine O-acetyltransferase
MISLSDSGARRAVSEGVMLRTGVHQGTLQLESPLLLHFGAQLQSASIAWRLAGRSDAPVVAALGGISAGRIVSDSDTETGWWGDIVGPARPLDTNRYQVLGIDFLGGSGASTGPLAGQTDFPAISSYDQAEILRQVLDHLRLPQIAAIVGASYGGMVALAFAERWPQRVGHIVAISAAHRSHPMATAWRSVQRAVVRYALKNGDGAEGLRLARALAMATYRSPEEFGARFSSPARQVEGRFQFPVEAYLLARGDAYAASYIPEAFVCLSESIDLHQVDAAKIRVPTTLVAIREDQLVPLSDMRALKDALAGPVELVELSSLFGHDAFLKEATALQAVFDRALQPKEGA